jgi:hypothetical protein
MDFYDTPDSDITVLNPSKVGSQKTSRSALGQKARSLSPDADNEDNPDRPSKSTHREDRAQIRNALPPCTTSPSPTAPSSSDPLLSSVRHQKQLSSLSHQLSHLSATDRASLAHLTASQQRATLLTTERQLATAQRSEQVRRTRLETATNHHGRLQSGKLVRVPPHWGCVGSLNR